MSLSSSLSFSLSAAAARRFLALLVALVTALAVVAPSSHAKTFTLRAAPTASAFWTANGATLHAVFDNGQCTEWAAARRPDVLRLGAEAIVGREIAAGQPENLGDWDARYWTANARAAGIATGHAPRGRALIVFQPGVLGAGSAGHIAYVQHVFADGSFEISQMHAPRLGHVSYERLTAADARLAGVSFIY